MVPNVDPQNVVRIGQFQLENLQRNRVGFLYYDLRPPELRESQLKGHPLLNGSQAVAAGDVVSTVRALNLPNHTPIVLICENGTKSVGAAVELEENGYINVFIIDGGTSALE